MTFRDLLPMVLTPDPGADDYMSSTPGFVLLAVGVCLLALPRLLPKMLVTVSGHFWVKVK